MTGTGANYLAAQFAVARAKSYPAFIYSSVVLDAVRSDMGPEFTDARLRDQLSASNPVGYAAGDRSPPPGAPPREAQDLANSASRHLARFITQIETVSGSTPVIVETAVQAGLPVSPPTHSPRSYRPRDHRRPRPRASSWCLGLGYRRPGAGRRTQPRGCPRSATPIDPVAERPTDGRRAGLQTSAVASDHVADEPIDANRPATVSLLEPTRARRRTPSVTPSTEPAATPSQHGQILRFP